MRRKYLVWNCDRAKPVGNPLPKLKDALANASALELRSGEHYVAVPA